MHGERNENMKKQKDKQDFMAWLKAQIPDTPEMHAIAQEESERIDLALADFSHKPKSNTRKPYRK